EKGILESVSGASINGGGTERLPNTSNLFFEGIDSQAALMLLDRHQVCCSAGSACKTGSGEGSHVMRAMHGSDERGRGSLRFSFGRFNSDADVDKALEVIPQVIEKMRRLSIPSVGATVVSAR